jgi:DNA segregation ATPase FtsK/SpoIIIE-like protein
MTDPLLYDRERDALRDLLSLLENRARREANLEAVLQAELQAAEREAAAARQKIAAGREAEAAAVGAAFRQAEEAAERRAKDEQTAVEKGFNEASLRISDQFEEAEEKAKGQYQEARWTLSSHVEAEEKRAQEELQAFKAKADAAVQQAESLRTAAEPRLARVGLALGDLVPAGDGGTAGLDADALAARVQDEIGTADALLVRLHGMRLLSLFRPRGAVVLFLLCWAAVTEPGAAVTPDSWLLWLIGGGVAAVAVSAGVWVGLRTLARRRAARVGTDLARSVTAVERDGRRLSQLATANHEGHSTELLRRHHRELRRVDKKFQPLLEKIEERRAFAVEDADRRHKQEQVVIGQRREEGLRLAQARRQKNLAASDEKHTRAEVETQKALAGRVGTARAAYDAGWAKLTLDWKQGLADAHAAFDFLRGEGERHFPDWDSPAWSGDGLPAPTAVPRGLRFGALDIDLTKLPGGLSADPRLPAPPPHRLTLPAYLPVPDRCGVVLKARDAGRARAVQSLQAMMLRFLTAMPPGKVRFTVIDPVGLGENFASFMHLADYDEQLVTGRIWTEPHQIEGRLADLTVHMENVIQKYLRNQYKSIEEYNEQAGEVAEAYRVLVVANFPVNFSADAARRLVSILGSGSGCGVYALVSVDTRQPLPTGFQLADLEQAATLVLANAEGDRFNWPDETFQRFPLALESAPESGRVAEVVHAVGDRAKHAQRVEVPFDFIAPPPEKVWTSDSRRGIDVPLGRSGATKRQSLRLGRGTAQHALVAGKTGSGKSTLLHALITNLALHYSPDEVELYLIDFKKGVEFKAYATHGLPHARVIAIESEREFGLSVLQRLDAELKMRGDRFRAVGVHDVAGYRDAHPEAVCPRILLIVDEFQEFFVEDDKLAQEAALLLDRLVRQGRAFGLHVLLGSQTLGGAYSLARSTIDQMAVRIALQCSEADAQLILSKDNAAARLLARPGEAIYNDANGRLEGNDLFQVVWLNDGQREEILFDLHERARGRPANPPLVFEGNIPAELSINPALDRLLRAPEWPATPPRSSTIWLGDAIAIKDPTTAVFRPQGGLNLLMIGQHEEEAVAMLTGAVVALSAQHAPAEDGAGGLKFAVLDGTPPDDPLAGHWARLAEGLPHPVSIAAGRDVREVLAPLADELKQRQEAGNADRSPRFVIVYGLHRFRDLRKTDDEYSFGRRGGEKVVSAAELFTTLLKDGPAVGIYCLIWCDSLTSLGRSIDRQGLRECELRVLFQMSTADSSHLIDSPLASRLGRNRALYAREEQPQPEKFRPYGLPSEEWLAWAKGQLRAKAAPRPVGTV